MTKANSYPVKESTIAEIMRKAGVAGVAGAAAVAGAYGLASMNRGPSIPKSGEPHKVYTVKPHDTAWGISERAFPSTDPRSTADMITHEAGVTLIPGEKVNLPENSHIGVEVSGSSNAAAGG